MVENSWNEKLEEIAALVVMLHPADAGPLDLIMESLGELETIVKGSHPPLAHAIRELMGRRESASAAEFIEAISKFVSAAQAYAQDPKPELLATTPVTPGWGADLSPHADRPLVIEFIEKHTALLDDLEARLMEAAHKGEGADNGLNGELKGYVKGYLHNIKGDAGSVGLLGIERVTHVIEDNVLPHPPLAVLDTLLAYREWVLATLRGFVEGTPPKVSAGQFLSMLESSSRAEQGVASSASPTPPEAVSTQDVKGDAGASAPLSYQIAGDPELLNEFLIEGEDHLNAVEELLLAPQESYSNEDLNAIFRAVHSIKGGSAYFNLREITRISHSAENLMDLARKGTATFGASLKAVVLRYIDIQRALIGATRAAMERDNILTPSAEGAKFLGDIEDLLASLRIVEQAHGEGPIVAPPPPQEATKFAPTAGVGTLELPEQEKIAPSKGEEVELKTFVKVDTERLDRMIEYIGEMVISSSTLIRSVRDLLGDHENVVSNSNQLERISREIQEIGMSMRLVPIKSLFQKMSRVVWDTAKKLKKDIVFQMSGEDTELDRTVIERLADPLMHMVRNAVDHGVESAEERAKAGKTKNGEVRLAAYQAGGNIYIQVQDDGKGLDPEKLIAHARKKGILAADAKLSREEAFMLIFAPGFSTAQTVTDVSGRGVGMDVVRRNIESMRGRVSIQSEIGKGSLFTIELPLTLAITEGLEAQVGEERYVIPTLSVVEFLRPQKDMVMRTLDRGETLKFRGSFLPIFRLAELYDINPLYHEVTDCIAVIIESNGRQIALLVDDVLGRLSVVVKSLGAVFEGIEGLGGCAVMPDGSVGLIIDVGSLISLAHTGEYGRGRSRDPREVQTHETEGAVPTEVH